MTCAKTGCKNEATHHPKIMVPAKEWPIEAHQPLGATLGLKLCLEHCKGFDVKGFLDMPSPKGNQTNKLIFVVMARGKMPPDFDRAYVQPVPIGCKESQILGQQSDGPDKPVPPVG